MYCIQSVIVIVIVIVISHSITHHSIHTKVVQIDIAKGSTNIIE